MGRIREEEDGVPLWLLGVAAAAGTGAIAYGLLKAARGRRPGRDRTGPLSETDALEEAAVETLRRDTVTGSCAIDVAAIAPGIIELTGVVPTHDAGQRAARLLHAIPGVRTVINRLDTGTVDDLLSHRASAGAENDSAMTAGSV